MDFTYDLIRSERKTLAIQVKADGKVIVRAPMRLPMSQIEAFIKEKTPWIEKQLAKSAARKDVPAEPFTYEELKELAAAAMIDLPMRVRMFAPKVGVTYGNITIRNQRSRWGSCSSQGNLNFNCLLMLCPDEVRDYVVVHELCHRKEMNHSPKFWAEVERVLPNYKQARKWLKDEGNALIVRLG